jgi:hypothetical protein
VRKTNQSSHQLSLFSDELQSQLQQDFKLDSDALVDWLLNKGFTISKPVANKYCQKFLSQLERVAKLQDVAKTINLEEDDDNLSNSIVLLAQSKILTKLLKYDPDTDDSPINLESLIRCISQLNSSSLGIKKYQQTVKELAIKASKEVSEMGREGGLSPEMVNEIREKILGIVA